jgi:uncharacterized protein (UPF0276 family)
MRDRVGLGWRPELALAIFSHLDEIDVVEVIADDYFDAGRDELRALRLLAAQVPLVLHGIKLGLASTVPPPAKLLDSMARLVDFVRPELWSEHLAFVRGGGIEIGHLAAPPRNAAVIEGTAENLARARAVVGAAPLMENVATLIDPPGSDRDEAMWLDGIVAASGSGLLLDLHNLYANAVNFGFDPVRFLDRIPIDKVEAVHLAGGKWIASPCGEQRLLDDHLHDVPPEVFRLLQELAHRAQRALTVILERDGDYPPIGRLLAELARAREALAAGRADQLDRAA